MIFNNRVSSSPIITNNQSLTNNGVIGPRSFYKSNSIKDDKIPIIMKRLFTTLLLMIAILIPTGVFGAVSLIDGNSYRIYTIVNNTKYYLNSEGYLVENLNDAYVFTFIKTQVDTTFSSTGWNLGVRFTNPTLTNGSSGNIVNDGHIHTSSWDRNDWERQVFYEKGGLYAIRATNSYSMYWGANTFWDVFSEGNLPEAGYSLQPSFVWRLEDLSSGLTEEPMLAMSDIFIGSDELLTVTIDLYQGNAAVTAFQADIVLPEGLTIQGNPKVVEGTLTNDNGEPSNPSVLYSGGKFVVYNSNGLTFNTDATSIVALNFKAASDFKGGIITLKNIVFSCDGNNKITTNDVEIIVSNCVLSLSDLSNYKSYMLTNQRATWCSTKSGLSTNQINDINDQMERFAIINNDGQYYIYSVSANAYLRSDKTFGDPQPVSLIQRNYDKYSWFFSFDDSHIINIQSNFQVVINGWNTADDGNLNAIVEVADFDPTIALDRLKSGQQAHLADTLSILYAEVDALLGVIDNTSTYTDVHGIVDEIRSTLTAIVAADYSTFDQITEARQQVRYNARYFFESITVNKAIDITPFYIINQQPTFNTEGWMVSQTPTTDEKNNVAEFWHKSGASISQNINLPAGIYRLTATALTRTDMQALLFANVLGNNINVNILTVPSTEISSRSEASNWFNEGNGLNQLTFTLEDNASVIIGLKADETNGDHWLVWRNFKLERISNIEEDNPLEEPKIVMNDFFIETNSTANTTIDIVQGYIPVLGFQADIILPEGLYFNETPKAVNGTLTDEHGESITPAISFSGEKLVVYNNAGLTFNKNASSVVTLSLTAIPDFMGGTISLKNIELSCEGNIKVSSDDIDIYVSSNALSNYFDAAMNSITSGSSYRIFIEKDEIRYYLNGSGYIVSDVSEA